MIKLKKLLKEEINGDGIEYLGGNNYYELYTILDRSGFSNFRINDNDNVADNFGFSEYNWNVYCSGNEGRHKQIPVILTKKDTNQVVGCFLSSQNTQSFQIRSDSVINLNYSFESINNTGYYTLEHSAPLYLLPSLSVTNNNDIDLDELGVMYQEEDNLIVLVGIYDDFCRDYPTAIEFRSDVTKIASNAINMNNLRDMAELLHTIIIPENVDIIDAHAIQVDGIEVVTTLDEPKDGWNTEDNTQITFSFGISDEERQARENQRLAEIERQRQAELEEENREATEMLAMLDAIDTSATNTYFDDNINVVITWYNQLTDEAKERHLDIMNIVNEKKQENEEAIRQEQERLERERREAEANRIRRRQENNIVVWDNSLIFQIVDKYKTRRNGTAHNNDKSKSTYLAGKEAHLVAIKRQNINTENRLVIPDEIEGIKVTEIADAVFTNIPLEEVSLPRYLIKIGRDAFYNTKAYLITSNGFNESKCWVEKNGIATCRYSANKSHNAGYYRNVRY